MEVLIVERDWKSAYNQTTTLKTSEGKVIEVIRENNKQPRYNKKEITITKLGKSQTYKLDWSNVNPDKRLTKYN